MDDFDLSGMDLQAAKEYIVAVISTLKQIKTKRIQLEKDLELWKSRVELAQTNSRPDLLAHAEVKAADVQSDLEQISGEEAAFAAGVSRMKAQLSTIQVGSELTVDTDRLLAEFELMTEKPDELTEKFKKEEADIALQELKEQMESEKDSGSDPAS